MEIAGILKELTAQDHDRAEAKMGAEDITGGRIDFSGYKRLLAINYWVHKYFEPLLYDTLGVKLKEALHTERRLKTALLEKDLLEAGLDPEVIGEHSPLFNADDIAVKSNGYKLGGIYVLEGATLGGKVIYKHLKDNSAINDRALHFYYYNAYEDTGAKWKGFIAELNAYITDDSREACVEGAKRIYNAIFYACDHYDRLEHFFKE